MDPGEPLWLVLPLRTPWRSLGEFSGACDVARARRHTALWTRPLTLIPLLLSFDDTVNFWVREREVSALQLITEAPQPVLTFFSPQIPGKGLLTEIINETHENSRYLPQMILPDNLVAVPSLVEVVKVSERGEVTTPRIPN